MPGACATMATRTDPSALPPSISAGTHEGSREWSLHVGELRCDGGIARRRGFERGDNADGRPQTHYTAGKRRITNGAGPIIAVSERANAGRNGRGCSTARAARGARHIPGIERAAVKCIVGEETRAERRNISPADH